MQAVSSDLSNDFLFPKLHGMWAETVGGEELLRIAESGQRDALARAFGSHDVDFANRAEVQKRLTIHLIDELGRVMRWMSGRNLEFYRAFIERFFFENLKTVLHYHYFPEHEVSIEFLLIDSPYLPAMDPKAILETQNVNQLYNQLPEHPTKRDWLPILVELDDTKDLFPAESKLDRLYYDGFLAALKQLPWSVRSLANDLVRTHIDTQNIIMILRNLAIYQLPAEKLTSLCLPNGKLLEKRHLKRLTEATRETEAVGALPIAYRKVLEPLLEYELYVSENALTDMLYRKAHAAFTDFNKPAASIIAFPFLRYFETLNVGRVFEGLRFGLDAREIRSMMIGVPDV